MFDEKNASSDTGSCDQYAVNSGEEVKNLDLVAGGVVTGENPASLLKGQLVSKRSKFSDLVNGTGCFD
jgi:hypothetical protein